MVGKVVRKAGARSRRSSKAAGASMGALPFAPLDPIMPVDVPASRQAEMVEAMRRIRREYGIRRFLVILPGSEVRCRGYAGAALFRKEARRLLAMKKALASDDVELGWWYAPSLSGGVKARGIQHIVGANGRVSSTGLCPLDERLAEDFARNVKIVAKIARPFMIQFEDDFELSNHLDSGYDACYCPLHLKKFEEKTGVRMTRRDLVVMFKRGESSTYGLRKAFSEVCRDSLASLAARIRKAVDEVDPSIRISQCEPMPTDIDGNLSEVVCQAFAGSTRPFIRTFGSIYDSHGEPLPLIDATAHLLYSAEHLPPHFEKVHESDTFPHNPSFMPASHLRTLLFAAFSFGIDGSLIYPAPYLDSPLDEPQYLDMLRENTVRFNALRKARKGGRQVGVQAYYNPEACWMSRRILGNPAISFAAHMGVPASTMPQNTVLLFGRQAEYVHDDELKDMLSRGLVLDSEAADALHRRGYGEYLGVEFGRGGQMKAFRQRIVGKFADKGYGRESYFFLAHVLLGDGKWKMARRMKLKGAESMVEYLSYDDKPMGPAVSIFENKLGGRVAVIASPLEGNASSAIMQLRMYRLFHKMLAYVNRGPLDAAVEYGCNIWCHASCSEDGERLLVTLHNLSGDFQKDLNIAFSQKWNGRPAFLLDGKGRWTPAGKVSRRRLVLPGPIAPMENVAISIGKP